MIYRLQKRFILICTVSVLTVIALVFGVILVLNISSMNRNMDMLADRVHRLVGILMDNAIKYCDQGGEITVNIHRGRKIVLTVENTYAAVGELELNRLFDRFYRADKARKFTGGYGVGLSMAKAIVEKHKGEITAYKKDATHIGFKIVL